MISGVEIPVIILAGGLGKRLRGITQDRMPKPMVPIPLAGEKFPFLEFPLAHLKAQGITEIVICIGHLGDQICRHFGDGDRFGLAISYDNAGRADTGGRVWSAIRQMHTSEYLVLCGDIYHPFELGHFITILRQHPQWMVQLAVAASAEGTPANLTYSDDGGITGYDARGVSSKDAGIDAGTLVVRRDAFEGCAGADDFSLTADLYPRLIAAKALGGAIVSEPYFDIGTPAGYERFCEFVGAGGALPVSLAT